MANHVALGKLRTTHTVTAKQTNGAYFSVTNPESIVVGSSMSLDGTNQVNHTSHYGGGVYGLYYSVRYLKSTVGGTQYDVGMNYTISDSNLGVGDTVYFDYDTYGMKVAKANVNVDTAGPRELLFDSRIRRRGVIYAAGSQSSLAGDLNFKGSPAKDTLNYIPLVISSESKSGQAASTVNQGTFFEFETSNSYGQQFAYYEDKFRPIGTHLYTSGPSTDTNINARESDNTCTNLNFKVLRIPCAFGFMTDANFKNTQTTDTSRGLVGGGRDKKDNKRVVSGDFTNSTAGFSGQGGIFVSRQGEDVTSCGIDDLILGTDNGIGSVALRGETQELARNYSDVISSGATPELVITASTSSATETVSASIYNPYSIAATPRLELTNSTSTSSLTSTTLDNSFTTYNFTVSGATQYNLSFEKQIYDLAVF